MTQKDVSYLQPSFFNSQQVSQEELTSEQSSINSYVSSLINNHVGSGVLPNQIAPRIIFDSSVLSTTATALLAAGNFDGTGLAPTLQPSDINLGNQLEIELTGSSVFGRL